MSIATSSETTRGELVERARRLREMADELEARATLEAPGTAEAWWAQTMDPCGQMPNLPPGTAAGTLVTAAVLAAMQGEMAVARSLAARAEQEALGGADLLLGINFARAIAWLGDGKCDAAFDTLAAWFGALGRSSTVALASTAGVLAEVAVRANRVAEARQVLNPWNHEMESLASHERQEFAVASLLLSETNRVDALSRALFQPTWTAFATARIQLALGMTLRREQRARESRPHLLIAADLLEELRAVPWLTVAKNELRAAGVRAANDVHDRALSAQEQAVVQLASKGLSNREIGERLYLSPRTVGSHLYRVFPKLGITSRHQLGG